MKRAHLLVILVAAVGFVGCDEDPTTDAGTEDGAVLDAADHDAGVVCERSLDCDDGAFCNGAEICAPGEAGAAANGCRPGTPPCEAALCVEAEDRCDVRDCTDPDVDGDGHDATECGGDDCDDDDGNRYPGNTEVCDLEGHDEDCVESTVGDVDEDEDGFIDAACCNGDTCGDDCDDADINVNPGASETCDGIDNNCSGVEDDSAGLCPGGTCNAGVCDFMAWDRALGGAGFDAARAVAVDEDGAVYVAGTLSNGADLGLGTESVDGGGRAAFVAKYSADNVPVWTYVSPGGSDLTSVLDMAIASDGSRIFVVGASASSVDFGSGDAGSNYLLVLDGAGAYVDDVRTDDSYNGIAVDPDSGDVVVVGARRVGIFGQRSLIVRRLSSALVETWEEELRASGTEDRRAAIGWAVSIDETGDAILSGSYRDGGLTIGGDSLPSTATESAFVTRFDALGEPVWAQAFASTNRIELSNIAIGADGRIYVGGLFSGTVDFGTSTEAAADVDGVLVGLTSAGEPFWHLRVGDADGGGADTINGAATSSSGNVYVVGGFASATNFGGGIRTPTAAGSQDGFLARYSALGVYSRFTRYAAGGEASSVQDVAVGPGDSVVVVGAFSGTIDLSGGTASAGGTDGYIVRLGS